MIDILVFLIFIAIIAGLVYRDRKKIELQGIVLMRKTDKGKAFLDRLAKKSPRFLAFF